MSKGKYSRKRGMNLRPLILVLTVALLLGATIGGTIAWLTAKTDDVVNTFTVGDVNITLKETEINWNNQTGDFTYGSVKDAPVGNTYRLIPGQEYKKDPVVAVVDSATGVVSEDCYLFVEVVETNNPASYLDYGYQMDSTADTNKWTKLSEVTGTDASGNPTKTIVWYRTVEKADATKSFYLLNGTTDNQNGAVTVKDTIVKPGTDTQNGTYIVMPDSNKQPKLEFTAYAIQKDNTGTAAEAWAKIPKN